MADERTDPDDRKRTAGRPRVVIAGASGFVGRALARAFEDDGYDVFTVGRAGSAVWGDAGAIAQLVDGADVLVNLAGKIVSCRYTDANRGSA